MSEKYTELENKLANLKNNPPWRQGGNGDEGSRAPYPGEWTLWQGQILILEAEIALFTVDGES